MLTAVFWCGEPICSDWNGFLTAVLFDIFRTVSEIKLPPYENLKGSFADFQPVLYDYNLSKAFFILPTLGAFLTGENKPMT